MKDENVRIHSEIYVKFGVAEAKIRKSKGNSQEIILRETHGLVFFSWQVNLLKAANMK